MPEHRDDLDAWLNGHVRPLLPPPGTFELIRKRARRRKMKRAALSAVAAAAVVAVAAAVPPVLLSQFSSDHGPPSALVSGRHSASSTTAPGSTQPSSFATGSVRVTSPPVPPPVPTPFLPSSVTFVGRDTGWVIGQAGVPGHCATQYCTSIARTDDAGRTWFGVQAPITGAPDGSQGASQIRFLNLSDGWAFGPQLWATHDGGLIWNKIDTGGLRVTALETRGTRAFAVWAHCSGRGTDYAANCRDFSLFSTPAGDDTWAPVPGTGGGFSLAGTPSSADLLLTGTTGYLLPPDGILVSGPISGTGSWRPASAATVPQAVACNPGPAQPDGQPSQAMLASTGQRPDLVLLCAGTPTGTATQSKTLYYSTDGGNRWQQGTAVPDAGVATSLSGNVNGSLVLATSQGIETAASVTSLWQPAPGALAAGGFSFAGMTTAEQGVALPAYPGLHAVWFTYDGGLNWRKSLVR